MEKKVKELKTAHKSFLINFYNEMNIVLEMEMEEEEEPNPLSNRI